MARHLLPIDSDQIEKEAYEGCSNREIADNLGCDEGTIRKRFAKVAEKGRRTWRRELRKMQRDAARAGSIPMLIFLGKNDLSQSDKPAVDETTPDKVIRIRKVARNASH